MSEQAALGRRYGISVSESMVGNDAVVFSFSPKGQVPGRGEGGPPIRGLPKFIVTARQEANGLIFDWSGTPDDPGDDRVEMEANIAARMKDRAIWIDRVTALVVQIEQWAKEFGWSSRRVGKRVDDAWIGKHDVPALLLQEDTCRIMLEPVARSIPGTEGVVDLYLMPAYDDIASLFFQGGEWKLQFAPTGDGTALSQPDNEPLPLSKDAFEKVVARLLKHAA